MSNYTDASYIAHNRNLPERDMDGSAFHAEPTAAEIASYEVYLASGQADLPPTAADMADDTSQNVADAIVRLLGLDSLVEDDEEVPEVGRKYFFVDGCVLLVRFDGTVAFTGADGEPAVTQYTTTAEIANHTFN